MGLINKIEEKLSGNKSSHTEEERLREQQGLGSSGTHHNTTSTGGLTGQGSHLGQQTGTTSSGLTGSSHPTGTHSTTTGSHNPLTSGNNTTHGSSGITGGTHPLVAGENRSHGVGQTHGSSGLTGGNTSLTGGQHNTSGLSGQGSHFAGHDNVNTHGSGLTGNTHGSGLTGNTHNSGLTGNHNSGLTGNNHSSGLTGSHNDTYGSGLTGNSHTGAGIGSNTHNSGLTGSSHNNTGLGSNTHHTGSAITGGTAVGSNVGSRDYAPGTHTQGHHNTHHSGTGIGSNTHHTSTSGNHEGAGFVPGSHPHANNDSAIPTAGGQKVGGVGEGVGHSHSGGAHETATDKIKNVLPGQHNAHDAYGNPIKESTTGAHTSSSHTGSHTTGAGLTGASHSGVGQTHGSSNLTGNHGHSNVGGVTGSHNNYSHPNQPGSGFSSAAQPLGHDSSFNERHSGPGAGTGLAAGAVGGAGLASAGHHNTHNTHQTGSGLSGSYGGLSSTQPGSGFTGAHQDEYTRGQQAAYSQHGGSGHNTNSGYAGEDNRGLVEKVKDKVSSKRSDQPDDPITGTNYDQKNRDQYTQGSSGLTGSHSGSHTQGSGLTGSHPGSHTQSSGLTGGNHTYGSGTQQQPGVGGITSGVDNTHIGSGSHTGTAGVSHEGRGAAYEAGFKDAVAALQGKK